MKFLTVLISIMTQMFLFPIWGHEEQVSTQDKVEMMRALDIEEVANVLSPEVTDLARELQRKLEADPNLEFSNNEELATGLVTLVVFVAARAYGDYIRGNGAKIGSHSFQMIDESIFDLN